MPKISQLPQAVPVNGEEKVVVLQDSMTKATTVDSIVALNNTVIVHSAPATLVASRINMLQSADTFTLPAANSVPDNTSLTVELPQSFTTLVPVIAAASGDTILYSEGSDTSITIDGGAIMLRLVSNGSNAWRV